MRPTFPSLALLSFALHLACAGPRAAAPGATPIAFAPEEIRVSALDLELASRNDEELLAIGTAAAAAGDPLRAAAAFDRLADRSPRSPHLAEALHGAGVAHERLGEWRVALERFRALSRAEGADSVEAAFREAECLYHVGDLAEARAALDRLAARPDLRAEDRVRALAHRGVVELESGKPDDAERSLRDAVALWQAAGERERLDPYPAAQAQYYLGEVYRGWFQAVRLDPAAAGPEALARDLEEKAQRLLSAQGHYLRAIRIGQPDWAIASGYRIGELYDSLHRELTEAPLPAGLAPEAAAAYRAELARRVRVLVTKAIAIYERTLAAAERTGADGGFVEETARALERTRRALVEAGGPDPSASPAVPADADPER
jgi:hypothetical protein